MRTSDFDYTLPPELIAQKPLADRDKSRLMVLHREDGHLEHRQFRQVVDFLRSGDVLVFNDSRVIPARLAGKRAVTGGRVEVLLLRRRHPGLWEALVRPARRVRVGDRLDIAVAMRDGASSGLGAEVVDMGERGIRVVRFEDEAKTLAAGSVALPPYIREPLADAERYQTVYATEDGSVAAPTAGLHFTPELIARIRQRGVNCVFVTLHVGLDTFRPVQEEDPRQHRIHSEYGVLGEEAAEKLSRTKKEGRRVVCVGTTAMRLVEAAAQGSGCVGPGPLQGWVDLFILPGYRFRMVDALITNFHLPRSTLLMLVSAFAGRELVLRAYREAVAQRYRFYSFGDAMLIN